jgi:hypothetical protein
MDKAFSRLNWKHLPRCLILIGFLCSQYIGGGAVLCVCGSPTATSPSVFVSASHHNKDELEEIKEICMNVI